MADFIFDQMTASDAAAWVFPDTLKFANSSVWTLQVTDNPATVTDPETFTITENGHSLTFAAHDMLWSSAAAFVGFTNGDGLELGGEGVDYLSLPDIGLGHANRIDSFGGDDVIDMTGWGGSYADDIIDAGDGNDTIIGSSSHVDELGNYVESDILQGGAGSDDITGGDGNDHIYGNLRTGASGLPDGDDRLAGGDGNDFIQGNAGNDTIDGGNGNDRIYGGGDNDSIDGGDGNDYLQGNKGDDVLAGGGGDDTIHGGAGNDAVVEITTGNDLIFGDDGNDTLQGGLGIDTLTGGAGNDVFLFFAPGDAPAGNIGATGPDGGRVDQITDFTVGEDHIALSFGIPTVFHASQIFHSAAVAEVYAEQIMLDAYQHPVPGAGAAQIAALQVGQDTYLFYNSLYGTVTGTDALGVDSAIRLVGAHANDITSASFGF